MTRRISHGSARRPRSHNAVPVLALLAAYLLPCMGQVQERSRADLRAEIAQMQDVVRGCASAASVCKAANAPADGTVAADGARPSFAMRWDWLREALETARTAKPDDRQRAMDASAARLGEIDRKIAGPERDPATDFRKARSTADGVLARPEFGAVAPPSWWDRLVARFWRAIGRLFAGVGQLGTRAPWIGVAMEWIFFLGTALGLLFYVRRNFQRQRLAATLRGDQAKLGAWDREATDWATLAEQASRAGEWREAVHCLYWAAIVRLEGRRAWRHNPARTPREYVRLLQPGSPQRESLGSLTSLLERVWYGLRPAEAADYLRARRWFERLSETGDGSSGSAGTGLRSELLPGTGASERA